MDAGERLALFEAAVLPHLGSAYNLARWLTGNAHDAEDLVQDSMVRAFAYFDGFRGDDGRAWLLAIVRNSFYTSLRRRRRAATDALPDDLLLADVRPDPEVALLRKVEVDALRVAVERLPESFREALVLREIEGLSYREIAEVARIPIGTVMSRLARGRALVRRALTESAKGGAT